MDDRKPRSSFLKLLSEPGFDFTPYFDKAVIQWLERNMSDFLQEAPQACKYFLEEPEYYSSVAAVIPLDDDKLVSTFIQNLGDSYQSNYAIQNIIPRLIKAGKADLALLNIRVLKDQQSEDLMKPWIEAISEEGVRTLAEANLRHCRWATSVRCALLKRLPVEYVPKVDPTQWDWASAKDIAQGVATLAMRWPADDVANFLQKYGPRYGELSCMSCGEKTAKSKPGYTLHRKCCDPNNVYPNIWSIIAKRTM